MKPEDPGPLPEPIRGEVEGQVFFVDRRRLANLDRALALDPHYADAMAYINLLIRERGDLRDTREEWAADKAVADAWVQKNLDTKKAQAGMAPTSAPPPPVPPIPGPAPTRIRVSGIVQEANLLKKIEAVYPPLAVQARISGMVRFTVIIGQDGTLENVQLISPDTLCWSRRHRLRCCSMFISRRS